MTKVSPKKKPKKKRKAGQPTRFNKDVQRIALLLAEKGFTDVEMSVVIGVSEKTFNNWKKAHPEFFESLKDEKLKADNRVVRGLYERAIGYSHDDVHISNYKGEITITDIIKEYPPDTTACIFWLKNRDPENWRDTKDLEVTVKKPLVMFQKPKKEK